MDNYCGLIGDSFSGVFISNTVFRLTAKHQSDYESLLYKYGFVKEHNDNASMDSFQKVSDSLIRTSVCSAEYSGNTKSIEISRTDGSCIVKISIGLNNTVMVEKRENESFHGFGFQRMTYDANGSILRFKKNYRWNEATVPFFLCSSGYGVFSANTYNHEFDFTGKESCSIKTSGGSMDLYFFIGPDFRNILKEYTDLTGRPEMVPAWAFGLCYAARLFENQEGLIKIAHGFRNHGIPCDMIGLEPGWEKYYYRMKWVWNRELFPDPGEMIENLHEMGYAFELWDSGDAPTSGLLDPENRRKWFSKRKTASIDIGVDFFKQDDPWPRCITSEEMVTNPDESIFVDDDEEHSKEEITNIANTLYSETVFKEYRKLTGKRTLIIFHSYASSFSSHRYPVVWAGDFKLGKGAVNASLSGHSMVTQDMRSELPDGIHFGFLMPFAFMDSWAYYLEPWLFSKHITEMVRFYSRLRSSLFPYLYSTFRISHETGIPVLRPMILEYGNDKKAASIHDQFMLGDALMVCAAVDRGSDVYLPEGCWIDYWTGSEYISNGSFVKADWPSFTGGALYARAGSIIPRMPALDSISSYGKDILILEIYPGPYAKQTIYEDDGISYDFEEGAFAKTNVECSTDKSTVRIDVKKTMGSYSKMPVNRKYILKVHSINPADKIKSNGTELTEFESLDVFYSSKTCGFHNDTKSNFVYIKPQSGWGFGNDISDFDSLYDCRTDGNPESSAPFGIIIETSQVFTEKEPLPVVKEKIIPSLGFSAVINPPLRVRLNHGDNWLPRYIYVSFEVVDDMGKVFPIDQEAIMDIHVSDGNHMSFTTYIMNGTGHFKRIDLAEPGKDVTAQIILSSPGIDTKIMKYCPLQDN